MPSFNGQKVTSQKFPGTKKEASSKGKVSSKSAPKGNIHSNGNLAARVNKQISQATQKVKYGKKI